MARSKLISPEFQKLNSNAHLDRHQINNQLITIEEALDTDLQNTDIRMNELQLYLSDLKSQIQQLKSLVANEKDPSKRANLYKIINNTLEICATFEGLYLKALEVKHRYRQEFANSIHRKIRLLEIDLEQAESVGELNKVGLVKVVNLLQTSFDKFTKLEQANINSTTETMEAIDAETGEVVELSDNDKEIKHAISKMEDKRYNLR